MSLHCCFCAHKIIFISFLVTNHQPSSPLTVPAHWACLSASSPSFSSPLPVCFQGFPSLYFTRVWVALLCPRGLQPRFPSPWGDLPSLLLPPGCLPGCPGHETAPWLWLEFGFLPCWTVHWLCWIWGNAKNRELRHIKQFLSRFASQQDVGMVPCCFQPPFPSSPPLSFCFQTTSVYF